MRILRVILILLTVAFAVPKTVHCQQSIRDVFPFLKGTKWKLIYSNKEEFFPDLFDEVLINNEDSTYKRFCFFEENNSPYLLVRKGNVYYKITKSKQLIKIGNRPKFLDIKINSLEKKEDIPVTDNITYSTTALVKSKDINENKHLFKLIDSITIKDNDTTLIRIYFSSDRNEYKFFINNRWVEELTCNKIIKIDNFFDSRTAILQKGKKMALVTLFNQKIHLPFEYDDIDMLHREPSIFIAATNGNYGLVDINYKVVIPFEYGKIRSVIGGTGNHFLLSERKDSSCLLYLEVKDEHFNW